MSPPPSLVAIARTIAQQHALDPALVCAIVEQESSWDTHAMRYEPGFRARYVAPLGLPPTEEVARSISWGLMQVMGQSARASGFAGKFLSALRTIEVVAFLAAILVAALAFHAWLASHDEQQRLQSTLAAQTQLIEAADSRERARDASLNETLAQIEKLKRATQTPEQILHELPDDLRLPEPLTIVENRPSNSTPGPPKHSPIRQGTGASKSLLTGSPGPSTSLFPAADNGSGSLGKLAITPMPQPWLRSRSAALCTGPEPGPEPAPAAACPPQAFALGNPLQRPRHTAAAAVRECAGLLRPNSGSRPEAAVQLRPGLPRLSGGIGGGKTERRRRRRKNCRPNPRARRRRNRLKTRLRVAPPAT